jgi:transcriptional regulator with XRE-family HTH domain
MFDTAQEGGQRMATRGEKGQKPWNVEKEIPGLGTFREPIGYESLISASKPNLSGKNLKALRKSLGMTQAEVAKQARVKQATVSFVESGNEEKAGPGARASIANVLIQAEYDRSIGKYGTPTPAEEIKNLRARIVQLERLLKVTDIGLEKSETQIEEWKKRYDAALELLGLKQKNIVGEAEYDAKIEAQGLEKIPPAEEETFRAEIEQHLKKGK